MILKICKLYREFNEKKVFMFAYISTGNEFQLKN